MSRGIGQAKRDLKLRADPHRAGIRKDHAMSLAIVEWRSALERHQGRTYGVGESPRDRSAVRIFEIQHRRRSGHSRENFDGVDFGVVNYIVKFDVEDSI